MQIEQDIKASAAMTVREALRDNQGWVQWMTGIRSERDLCHDGIVLVAVVSTATEALLVPVTWNALERKTWRGDDTLEQAVKRRAENVSPFDPKGTLDLAALLLERLGHERRHEVYTYVGKRDGLLPLVVIDTTTEGVVRCDMAVWDEFRGSGGRLSRRLAA